MRWAVVIDGIVDNVVLWDGDKTIWLPPDGATMVPVDDAPEVGSGWTYRSRAKVKFTPPAEPETDPLASARAVIEAQADPNTPNPSTDALLTALAQLALES